MNARQELETWLWIPRYWTITYALLTIKFLILSPVLSGLSLEMAYGLAVVLLVVPFTYKHLVGGGCSLRFRVCALVKGIIAGMIMMGLTIVADMLLFISIPVVIELSAVSLSGNLYSIWLFAGLLGGFAARIIEARSPSFSSS